MIFRVARLIFPLSDSFSLRRAGRPLRRLPFGVHNIPYIGGVMRSKQGSVLETLRRSQNFLDAHVPLLDSINKLNSRRILDDVVEKLATYAVVQDGSTRSGKGETKKQRTLRLA